MNASTIVVAGVAAFCVDLALHCFTRMNRWRWNDS